MHGKAQQNLKLAQKEARKMENALSPMKGKESVMLNVGLVDKHCIKQAYPFLAPKLAEHRSTCKIRNV